MKNILPHITIETNPAGQVKVVANDYELFDYISDYFIEQCNIEYESLNIDEENKNIHGMLFSKKYKLEEIENYLLKLDPQEVKRIYSLNN